MQTALFQKVEVVQQPRICRFCKEPLLPAEGSYCDICHDKYDEEIFDDDGYCDEEFGNEE